MVCFAIYTGHAFSTHDALSAPAFACANAGTSTDRPNGRPPIHPNGTLVKTASNGTVYLIDGGRKRGITSQQVLNSLYTNGGFSSNEVITIDSDELNSYSPGSDVSSTLTSNGRNIPDGKLISNNGGEISIVSNNGSRRPFTSFQRFQSLGYQTCNVTSLPAADYNSYQPVGMAAGDYPSLNSPTDGSTGQPTTPTLTWSQVAGANTYTIAVATSTSALPVDPGTFVCQSCTIFSSTSGTSYTPSAGVLNPNTQYFWKVEAINVPDYGVWSATRSFTTAPATDSMQLVSKLPADGTVYGTNTSFTTTWRLQNTGQTTWDSSYSAIWVQTPVDGHESSNLTSPLRVGSDVPHASPGNTVDLTVTMITPPEPGTYYMYWQLQNGSGTFFGPRFYVQIVASQAVNESFGSDSDDFGSSDSPGSNVGMNDESLNTATGNFNYRVTDLIVSGRGMDFVFGRSYNSQDTTGGPIGPGWSHSFNIYLSQSSDPGAVSVHYGDGKVLAYGLTAGNTYKARSKGYYDTVFKNSDGTWTLLKPDQREFHFNVQGRLGHVRDRNGNQITLYYGADNSLARVVDTVGREFVFTYTNSLLTGVTDPINRRLFFQYNGDKLTLFRDAKNNPNNYSYNGAGRISEMYDARNVRVMANGYDSQGRLTSQLNGRNFQWSVSYDDVARSTTVTDPNLKPIVYSYDAGHKLVSFTNRLAQQNKVKIDYDSNNNRGGVNDPNSLGSVYQYLYDDRSGYVTKSTDPDLKTRGFVYDAKNNPVSATDELSHTTSMGYDARGNMITLTDALTNATSVIYDQYGQPTAVNDPNRNTTTLSYDPQGNLVRVQDAMNNATQYGYDAIGRRTSVTDARSKTTRFTYDENDNLTAVQRPIGTTTYSYDQADNLTGITDPARNLTTFEYDAGNNVVVERDATRVSFIQRTYDPLDRLVATRDKRGNTTSFEYDPEGRLLSVTDPMLNKTSYTYDGNGNRLSVTDPNNQKTSFTYDNLNRLKSVQDPLINTESKEYDAAGRLTAETDANGNAARYTYDETNNLIRVDDAEAGVTRYTYDANHNMLTQVDPNVRTSKFTYDKANRLIIGLDPLDNRYDYEYDGVGNRISQTDAKRQTTRFAYDDNNRLSTITYPDLTAVHLTYDLNDNLIQVADLLGTTRYAYDPLNRVTSYTDVYGKTIGYQYDENGNVTALTYPDGKQVRYAYDKGNRMTSLTDWGNMTVSYDYNPTNQLTKITPPSGSDTGPTNYSYDPAGRLTGMTNVHSRGSNNTYAFTLDRNGNRTAASVQEPLNNRVAATTQGYGYDAANRIQSAGGATFTSDANGNMTGRTENGATTRYTYDANDRLTGDGVNTFFYNGQGVRVAKSRQGAVTRYVVDVNRELSQMLCETDGAGNIISYYVYGQGLAFKVQPDGAHYYYQFDPNGSTVSMTTFLDFYVNRYTYDPYGKVTNSAEVFPNTGTTVPNPFKFGGRFGLIDDGNGLVYVRARYYSPELGRFLTKDPLTGDLKDGQSLNRYIYALDNPVRFADVNGLAPQAAELALDYALNLNKGMIFRNGATLVKNLNVLQPIINSHGSDITGKLTYGGYRALPLVGGLYDIGNEAVRNWNNPNMDWTEKAARVSLKTFNQALLAIPEAAGIKVNPFIQAGIGTAEDRLFNKEVNLIRKVADPIGSKLYDSIWTKPENSKEYKSNEQRFAQLRQKQKANKITTPKVTSVKVMPRGPAATPIMPRGPKPAPVAPRGPSKKR